MREDFGSFVFFNSNSVISGEWKGDCKGFGQLIEPRHEKNNKMTCTPSEDLDTQSDQSSLCAQ